jgi:hypothetical protein
MITMKIPRTLRLLGMGWWLVHLVGMAIVFAIGAIVL